LGLLIRKFGHRIDGGYEVFIPEGVLQDLGSRAQIQVEPDFQRKGFKFRVFLNTIVNGTWSEVKEENGSVSGSRPDQLAKTDEPPAA